jgi:hypothetical protein
VDLRDGEVIIWAKTTLGDPYPAHLVNVALTIEPTRVELWGA